MTEHEGDFGLAASGSAASGMTAEEGLAKEARWFGRQYRSAAITPFGDVEHVVGTRGSARLLGVLGVTSPTTADNAPGRLCVVDAHCDAFKGREPGDDDSGSLRHQSAQGTW